jgi:flagellar hook-associated protein FlgK
MSSSLQPASKTEKFLGSLPVESALTAVSAIAGGPLVALLPVLGKSLAAERQKLRVEKALNEINNILNEHSEALVTFSDEQYKLINEAILTLLQTTSEQKISYLKKVIRNTIDEKDIEQQEAVVLSRIVREISADEINFLYNNFAFERILVTSIDEEHDMKVLKIKPDSHESLIVTGLVLQGILENGEPGFYENDFFRYSKISAKLMVILK